MAQRPACWYRLSILHLLLYPLSLLFGLLAALRRFLYRQGWLRSEALSVPVIIIGNITVGGTGKTPFTLALAHYLIQQGFHPLIISRGYGGQLTAPTEVTPDHRPAQTGDEPLLMAQRQLCPVWIGTDRVNVAQQALQQHPRCNVILSDDGLQHYRLQRDLELVIMDGDRGLGNQLLLPAGPLREPVRRLQQVDAVVINGAAPAAGQYQMRLIPARFYQLTQPEITRPASAFTEKNIHAVAGIGHPQRFFNTLSDLGIEAQYHAFDDHHPFTKQDLTFSDCNAILMTEKDAVKCKDFADDQYWVLPVHADIDLDLLVLIKDRLNTYGRKTA